MGVDVRYQALPSDCEILRRASSDSRFGENLCGVPAAFTRMGVWSGPPSKTYDELYALVRQLMSARGGIETRCLADSTRRWDALHYLLSESRRQEKRGATDIATVAIVGDAQVGALTSTTGHPIRFASEQRVRDVATFLADVTRETLAIHCDARAMVNAAVYKVFEGASTAELLDETSELFGCLRSLYISAAARDEGMLVVFE